MVVCLKGRLKHSNEISFKRSGLFTVWTAVTVFGRQPQPAGRAKSRAVEILLLKLQLYRRRCLCARWRANLRNLLILGTIYFVN